MRILQQGVCVLINCTKLRTWADNVSPLTKSQNGEAKRQLPKKEKQLLHF